MVKGFASSESVSISLEKAITKTNLYNFDPLLNPTFIY